VILKIAQETCLHSFSASVVSREHHPWEPRIFLTVSAKFCWLHTKMAPSQVGYIIVPSGLWSTFGPLSHGWSRNDFPGTFWTHGRIIVAGIVPFGEVTWHSVFYEFHSCALCGVWKLPSANHGAMKLTQNCVCFTGPCINLPLFRLQSLVNTTQRCLNFSACCSVLLLTCSIHCCGFLAILADSHATSESV